MSDSEDEHGIAENANDEDYFLEEGKTKLDEIFSDETFIRQIVLVKSLVKHLWSFNRVKGLLDDVKQDNTDQSKLTRFFMYNSYDLKKLSLEEGDI